MKFVIYASTVLALGLTACGSPTIEEDLQSSSWLFVESYDDTAARAFMNDPASLERGDIEDVVRFSDTGALDTADCHADVWDDEPLNVTYSFVDGIMTLTNEKGEGWSGPITAFESGYALDLSGEIFYLVRLNPDDAAKWREACANK